MDATTTAVYSAIAAIISAIVALVGSIAGPTISLIIARKQIKAGVVSGNRLRWIEHLRQETSEFLALINIVAVNRTGNHDMIDKNRTLEYAEKILTKKATIELLLNPHEQTHNELLSAVNSAGDACLNGSDVADTKNRNERVHKVMKLTKRILKDEWERVKKIQ